MMLLNSERYYFLALLVLLSVLVVHPKVYSQAKANYNEVGAMMRLPDSKSKVDIILVFISGHRKDSSIEVLFKEAFRVVDKLEYEAVRPRLLDAYGVYKRDFSQYTEALELHKASLSYARKLNNPTAEIFALNNIGVVYRRIDENSIALNYHMDALKLAEREANDSSVSIALNSIGNIHLALGNYPDAIRYFLQSLPIALKANNNLGMAMNYNNIGEAYELQRRLDSAQFYYNLSLHYNEKIGSRKGIAICYNSLGSVLVKQGKVQSAIYLFKKALAINEALGDKIYIAVSDNRLGEAYTLTKDYENAERMFLHGLHVSQEIGSKTEAQNAYKGLMQIHSTTGNYKEAFAYSKLFKEITDSIVVENNNRHVREMEAIYRSEKESTRNKLLETKRRNDRIVMAGSLILLFLLFLSGILYYLRRRLLEHNKGLQRELEIRSQIASDLHDDMGSTLSSIYIFSELLRRSGNNSGDLLTKIEANARETMEALDDIIWLVKPSNDKFSNLGVHIREYAIPLFESKDINFQIDFPDAISELPLEMEVRRNIFLIIKEAVNNLIKYSGCSEAQITAVIEGGNIIFTIKDNGKGFDPEQLTNRNGLKNMRNRARQIHSPITIHSAPGEGAEINFVIKFNEKLKNAV